MRHLQTALLLAGLASPALWGAACDGAGNGNGGGGDGGTGGGTGITPPEPSFKAPLLAEFTGAQGYDWLGLSLTMAGDVTGDGAPDLITAALSASEGGLVGVFLGPVQGKRSIAEADALIAGEFQFNNAGQSLSEAGACDVDGDGIGDILLGSPFADRLDIATTSQISGDNNGRAFLVLGGPGLTDTWAAANRGRTNKADVTFVGASAHDAAGFTVACAGDLDGDGRSDIAIAAPRAGTAAAPRTGAVYLFYGRPRAELPFLLNLEDADATLRGESPHDSAGTAVTRAGDMNGDGFADLAVGAPGRDDGGPDSGAVYLITGSVQRFSGEVLLSTAAAVLTGDANGQRVGASATPAGDFDGDGTPDLLLGTSSVGGALSSPGKAFVVPGGAGLVGRVTAASVGVTLVGEKAGDIAGLGVTALGDLNGDGRTDVAVGAPGGDGVEAGAGRAYAIAGRAVAVPSTLMLGAEVVFALGGSAADHLGEVLSGRFDLSGDGVPDVAVSARGRGVTPEAAGSVYVVSGKEMLP